MFPALWPLGDMPNADSSRHTDYADGCAGDGANSCTDGGADDCADDSASKFCYDQGVAYCHITVE